MMKDNTPSGDDKNERRAERVTGPTEQLLQGYPLFRDFIEKDLTWVKERSLERVFPAESTIVTQGDRSRDMYIILSGEVNIHQKGSNEKVSHTIAVLKEGEIFGEMSYADGEPRTSTVMTTCETRVLEIPYEAMVGNPKIHTKIIGALASLNFSRLRRTTDHYVRSLKEQMQTLSQQHLYGQFSIVIIFLLGITSLLSPDLVSQFKFEHKEGIIGWVTSMLVFAPFLYIHVKSGLTMKEMGFTTERPLYAISVGVCYFLVSLALMIGTYLFFTWNDPQAPTVWTIIKNPYRPYTLQKILLYVPLVLIQEYLARSIIQTVIERFLNDKRGILTVLLTSYLFGLIHIHRGIGPFIFSGLGSLVPGLAFLKTRNIISPCIVHYFGGFILINILGLI